MIYRAAQLEEIVTDLMDMVEQERETGQKLGAAASMARLENSHLRKTLCSILAATQESNPGDIEHPMIASIGVMIEDALATAHVFHDGETV